MSVAERRQMPADERAGPNSSSFPSLGRNRLGAALVEELATGDDALDGRLEAVAAGREPAVHVLDQRLVGDQQAAPERVREQLAAEVVDEIGLAVIADVPAEPRQSFTLAAAREGRARVGGPAG